LHIRHGVVTVAVASVLRGSGILLPQSQVMVSTARRYPTIRGGQDCQLVRED